MAETADDSRDALQGLDPDIDDEDVALDYGCGELRMLSETFTDLDGDTTSETTASAESAGSTGNSGDNQGADAFYGPPLDEDQAAAAVPEGKVNTTQLSISYSLFHFVSGVLTPLVLAGRFGVVLHCDSR